ncbi:hypothetical protein GGR51DRAFT_564898 [Nemania sp. FL0031]|nr:hypothetical protein GGR51DRAFT_564898 [Nemania sp. FL0031]
MSQHRPIVYITGGPGCGTTALGKQLAADFNFYYICLEDCRSNLLESIRAGIPWVSDEVRECLYDGREVPRELCSDYETVPAVIQLYNELINSNKGWTASLATAIIDEEISEIDYAEKWGAKYKGIMIDGHPLTAGNVSYEVVEKYRSSYSGLTIAISSPEAVAEKRYVNRIKAPCDDEARFSSRIKLLNKVLREFLDKTPGQKVYFENEEDMDPEEAYHALCSKLEGNDVWKKLREEKS